MVNTIIDLHFLQNIFLKNFLILFMIPELLDLVTAIFRRFIIWELESNIRFGLYFPLKKSVSNFIVFANIFLSSDW